MATHTQRNLYCRRGFLPTEALKLITIGATPNTPSPPQLAEPLRWVLNTQGPQPLRRFDSGELSTRVKSEYADIEHISQMNLKSLPAFVTSSRDERLLEHARLSGCKIAASTSSMTSSMSQVYYALSRNKCLNSRAFSQDFQGMSFQFTANARKAANVVLRKRAGGVWGLDSMPDPASTSPRVLMELGKALEIKLTTTPQSFRSRVLVPPGGMMPDACQSPSLPEAYAFTKIGRCIVRSQLDCIDEKGNVFDLKTRAVLSIRHNVANYEEHVKYGLDTFLGQLNSYEREWYDLARSVMMKYSFQVRLGRMAGVFVAYHNTAKIFGLEFVPLQNMDAVLFGSTEEGNFVFDNCVKTLDRVFGEITSEMSDANAVAVSLNNSSKGVLDVFFERVLPDEPLGRTDALSEDELLAALRKRNVNMKGSNWGTLATAYDEFVVDDVRAVSNDENVVLAHLYEKARLGYIQAYKIEVTGSCFTSGAVSYTMQKLEESPLKLAQKLWYLRRPKKTELRPILFMYHKPKNKKRRKRFFSRSVREMSNQRQQR